MRSPPTTLDIAQLKGWVNAIADMIADRVADRLAARLQELRPMPTALPAERVGPRLFGMKDLQSRVSLSRTTIYRMMQTGTFPKPVRVGKRSMWLESNIEAWIASAISQVRPGR